jgi:tRNA pseudouridine32 synthase/23S rRNA pseudouridine746 synthase
LAEILYHDEAVIALCKPAGRIVVPGRGAAAHELTLRDEVGAQLGCRPYVVHRLDRGTSGVLLFALTAEAHRALSMAFERHEVDKRYWALCQGTLVGAGEIDRALVSIRGGRVRPVRDGEQGGKASVTAWRALTRWGDREGPAPGPGGGGAGRAAFTAVELRPRSGRLHQIRAHVAWLGHPLAVDPDYGGAPCLRVGDLVAEGAGAGEGERDQVVVARPTLHASALRVRHPVSGAMLNITAPLAADLARAVAILDGGV